LPLPSPRDWSCRIDSKVDENKLKKCTEKRGSVCQREYRKKKTNKNAQKLERKD